MVENGKLGAQLRAQMEELDAFGDAAETYFKQLADTIRADFTEQLAEIISQDLAAFHNQVQRSFVENARNGNTVGDAIEDLFPQDSIAGDVFGSAANGALRTVLRDLARRGSIDLERVVRGANRQGSSELDRILRSMSRGDLRMDALPASAGQRFAELWRAIGHAQRNI